MSKRAATYHAGHQGYDHHQPNLCARYSIVCYSKYCSIGFSLTVMQYSEYPYPICNKYPRHGNEHKIQFLWLETLRHFTGACFHAVSMDGGVQWTVFHGTAISLVHFGQHRPPLAACLRSQSSWIVVGCRNHSHGTPSRHNIHTPHGMLQEWNRWHQQ